MQIHQQTTALGFSTIFSAVEESLDPIFFGDLYRVVFVALEHRGKIFRVVIAEEFGEVDRAGSSVCHTDIKTACRSENWRGALAKAVRRGHAMEVDPDMLAACVTTIEAAMHDTDSTAS